MILRAENIVKKYGKRTVVKGVSFNVKGTEKIGVCGRTGSGKSSLMVALFRIEPLNHGDIIIDGIKTTDVPLKTLRES